MTSSYLDRPMIPITVALPRMLAKIDTEPCRRDCGSGRETAPPTPSRVDAGCSRRAGTAAKLLLLLRRAEPARTFAVARYRPVLSQVPTSKKEGGKVIGTQSA